MPPSTGGDIPHGTLTGYKKRRCRCDACRAASNAYQVRRTRLKAYGRWEGRLDATPVREHVQRLVASGVPVGEIAQQVGTQQRTIAAFLHGKRWCTPETRDRIMAVHGHSKPGAKLRHDVGTMRRLQALACLGWSTDALGARIGMPGGLNELRNGSRYPLASTKARIVALYDELWDQPRPATDAHTKRAVTMQKRLAAENGWMPPMAWDDDTIDDPDARPDLGAETTPRDNATARRAEALWLLHQGEPFDQAARRAGYRDPSRLRHALERTAS